MKKHDEHCYAYKGYACTCPTSPKKSRIVIVMDGGLIQHILGDTENVEIAMIDYDIEGADADRLIDIPQTDSPADPGMPNANEQAYCWVQDKPDEVNPTRVNQLFDVIAGR